MIFPLILPYFAIDLSGFRSGSVPGGLLYCLLWLCLYLYFTAAAASGYRSVLGISSRFSSFLSYFAGLLWPLGGLLLLPGIFRPQSRRSGTAAAFCLLFNLLALSGKWHFSWLLFWCGLTCFILAVLLYPRQRALRYRTFLPLIFLAGYIFGMSIWDIYLKMQLNSSPEVMAAAIGRSVTPEAFWLREKQALSIHQSPLKDLIGSSFSLDLELESPYSSEEANKKLNEFRRLHPSFIQAADQLTGLPPRATGHDQPATGQLHLTRLPELPALLQAGRYYALRILADSRDRDRILDADARLANLRDRLLLSAFIISRRTGLAIETMRLNALAAVMPENTLSPRDWENLLNPGIDLEGAFRSAMGDEATCLYSLFGTCCHMDDFFDFLNEYSSLRYSLHCYPLELSILARRDSLFTLKQLRNLCRLHDPEKTDLLASFEKFHQDLPHDFRKKLHPYSAGFLPAMGLTVLQAGLNRDLLTQARTARKILDMQKINGKLPETLEDMGEIPVSCLDGKPFRLEKGNLTIRNSRGKTLRQKGFRIFAENNSRSSGENQYFVPFR